MADLGSQSDENISRRERELNFYEILEVSVDSNRLQIREAYIRLRSAYAASSQVLYSLVSEEDAKKSMETLEEAYRVLDDDVLRRDYDAKIFGQDFTRSSESQHTFGHDVKQQIWPRYQHRASGATAVKAAHQERHAGIDDLWASQTRPEARGGGALHATGESAKTKRFSMNAFDEPTRLKVQQYIENASVCDGAFFIGLRDILSVSQEEIQDKTKISLQYIKAIENDDFRCLPSIVYVKGFLKCYLQYLGLEQESARIIDAFTETYQNWRIKKGMGVN
ncbi:MAG: helix-turn-helix domain-containing protein [Oligoflexus sp.]